MNELILQPYVRPVTDEDRNTLPTFSHSKLECFENCEFMYDKKYNQKKYSSDTSIALELGTLCHLVLELKGRMLTDDENFGVVNYDKLIDILENGFDEITEKSKEHIPGLVELKGKYWEIWSDKDSEGHTYDDKIELFKQLLYHEMEDGSIWEPYKFEHNFEFVWDNRAIIRGFIDRIDIHGEKLRTVDYKTSKKIFDAKKLPTSQQFGIYALAILNEFGKLPSQSLYRFIFLDEEQLALTKGWEKRLIKKLTKTFDKIDECTKSGIWTPKPTPLCHWCSYCKTNPNATEYRHDCEYHSLWTPTEKTFAVNQSFDPSSDSLILTKDKQRKLVF